ncbi:CsgG/HfaB family protein [Desulfogranum japonicum]|uniref:CsgG/HfaB family protein n=1 Tax=Desulfogranum japonicum TaxID=231447 RepID=UPI000687504B|nr:CsgG/HfaB family protein [Desulfogranum japonicum]
MTARYLHLFRALFEKPFCIISWFVLVAILSGCATETNQVVQPTQVTSANTVYYGAKTALAVGKFDNRSEYMRGLFSDGIDRLGSQSKTILISHLQQTGRFNVLDRSNMEELAREAALQGTKQNVAGAKYVVTGQVTEFGRKQIGDVQLFGILGAGKQQSAYAKVTLNIVDVKTSGVVFSVQGAGEYTLSNREILGTGGTAGYDSTLNGKVLDLAIREAVNHLVEGMESGKWNPVNG